MTHGTNLPNLVLAKMRRWVICVCKINKGTCKKAWMLYDCCTKPHNCRLQTCLNGLWWNKPAIWFTLFLRDIATVYPTGWPNLPMVKSQQTAKTVCVQLEANKGRLVWMAVCTLNDSSILNDLFIIDSLIIFNGHWALQLSLGAIMIRYNDY